MTFSDAVRIPSDGRQDYEDIPESTGAHRLVLSVEGGPSETDHIRARDWSGHSLIMASIRQGTIDFDHGHLDLPTGC